MVPKGIILRRRGQAFANGTSCNWGSASFASGRFSNWWWLDSALDQSIQATSASSQPESALTALFWKPISVMGQNATTRRVENHLRICKTVHTLIGKVREHSGRFLTAKIFFELKIRMPETFRSWRFSSWYGFTNCWTSRYKIWRWSNRKFRLWC